MFLWRHEYKRLKDRKEKMRREVEGMEGRREGRGDTMRDSDRQADKDGGGVLIY